MSDQPSVSVKKLRKSERIRQVLMGLVELYIQSGKPIGSETLRKSGFEDLSSATIRNYFAKLEEEGYLAQPHSSGGRQPTEKSYQLYSQKIMQALEEEPPLEQTWFADLEEDHQEVGVYLQKAANVLSQITSNAVFISSPRFDHDFISDIRLLEVSDSRYVCVIITDFGQIHTEVFHFGKEQQPVSSFGQKRIESYFRWRLKGTDKPENLVEDEVKVAEHFYQEIMLRYLVRYSHFSHEEVYRTGFSQLIQYSEFGEAASLANALALFEDDESMRQLLTESANQQKMKAWIGSGLQRYVPASHECAVIAVPYKIHQTTVGAVGVLGPMRLPYKKLCGILAQFSSTISRVLTSSVYRFKISYRKPEKKHLLLEKQELLLLEQTQQVLKKK